MTYCRHCEQSDAICAVLSMRYVDARTFASENIFAYLAFIDTIVMTFGSKFLTVVSELVQVDQVDYINEALDGAELTPSAVQALEEQLKLDADAHGVRAKLIGYYFNSRFDIREHSSNLRDHVLWFIKTLPEDSFTGCPYGHLISSVDGQAAYDEGKKLWLDQVEKQPRNLLILENAASYLFLEDRDFAEKFLKQCKELDPENAHWSGLLAQLYELPPVRKKEGAQSEQPSGGHKNLQPLDEASLARAAAAFAEREHAYSLAKTEAIALYTLTDLPQCAINCGELEKAKLYADRLLDLIDQHLANRNYSNSVYEAHTALGRIALREGNVELAKEHLLKSVAIPGSPQLNSFGPDMALAQELLNAGEKEIIFEFFFRVGIFWKSDCIAAWANKIRNGITPDLSQKFIPEGE
ncbi:MAG: hypothetical protein SGJ27_25585 [Candidatus Melainabacteria bacterium]|nr:hypothetical protein [Candidatus Melainabacteria bacterium]